MDDIAEATEIKKEEVYVDRFEGSVITAVFTMADTIALEMIKEEMIRIAQMESAPESGMPAMNQPGR